MNKFLHQWHHKKIRKWNNSFLHTWNSAVDIWGFGVGTGSSVGFITAGLGSTALGAVLLSKGL